MEPITWAVLIMAVLSAAGGAYASLEQGKAAEKSAKYSAKVNEINAETANQQALFDAGQTRLKNARLKGAQRTAAAASGIDDSGSVLDVENDSAIAGEMEALTSIYTGGASANANRNRAKMNLFEGAAAKKAGYIGAGTSLLTGAKDSAVAVSHDKKYN